MATIATKKKSNSSTKITKEAIADAVLAIGLTDVTVKDVATRLGVSLPGLYHHVSGREDLLRIGSERLFETAQLPDSEGLDWQDWLRAVCRFLRTLMASEPECLVQYVSGAVPVAYSVRHVEQGLAVLRASGFSLLGALDAFHVIGQLAVGAASEDVRQDNYRRSGQPSNVQLHVALSGDHDTNTNLNDLLHELGAGPVDRFEQRLDLVIAGIAASHAAHTRPDEASAPRKRPKAARR